ncbi:unnamed protein product [Mycena citricolor]|uniref:Uncharacterized protein n=1 Tax=Mycena citricolor TaxID=2018698 RepID=A0AAD2HHJ1_9AGAR|nr:unnamed protein product [Mycena citricolor]
MLSLLPLLAALPLLGLTAATPTGTELARRAACTPAAANNAGTDDVPAIQAAFKSCGNGGTIVIPAGRQYNILSTLSLAGCVNCDWQIEGTLKMSGDLTAWKGVLATILISGIKGGQMRSLTGSGVIDGNGVPFWTEFAADSSYRRPTLVYMTSSTTSFTISNLRFKNPANVFHSVGGGSSNIIYENLRMDATSTATAIAKNTDGFDIGTSKFVTVRNVTVTNQDDCVALKAGADHTTVTGITCTGSHGLSVGSLGGGQGSSDVVSNAILGPATMINSAKAVGIKLYQGGSTTGTATISNVTWTDITVQNCDYAVQIQSCYGAANTANCVANTDSLTGVTFNNIHGTTSSHYAPVVANMNCSPGAVCDVVLKSFNVKPPSGTAQVLCSNIDGSLGSQPTPVRTTCTPAAANDVGVDDVPAISAAFKACGTGGIVLIPPGSQYNLRSPLSLAGCVGCDWQIEGRLKMSGDVAFWEGVPSGIVISGIKGGMMHSLTGSGLVDGNGVPFWIEFAANSTYKRPTLVSIEGSSGFTVSNLRFKDPANVFHVVKSGSSNILYQGLRMDATSTANATAKNTDGFDVGSSKFVTIKDTIVVNQDDCVALKPGASFTTVTNITCSGSHGLSVGSLGRGQGITDTVQNAILGPARMINSNKAIGIKLYEGGSVHGRAKVSNVTWTDISVENCDYAVQIQSCYNAADPAAGCIANTDALTGIVIRNVTGTTSKRYAPVVANLNCAPGTTCDVGITGFDVSPATGTATVLCSNIDGALGIACDGPASG